MKLAIFFSLSKELDAHEYVSRSPAVKHKAPFGYCPQCQGVGSIREKRENGVDTCVNGPSI